MGLAPFNAKIQDYLGNKKIGKPLWGIFFGIELEYEIDKKHKYALANPDISKEIPGQYENSPFVHHVCDVLIDKYVKKLDAFIKRDGSLSDGIEIVTLPIDITEIAGRDGRGDKRWREFFDAFDDYGIVVRATCGMHVHVSRELLTPLQIGKILHFLHNPDNLDFIKDIAGRTPPNKYANITAPKKISDSQKHTERYDGLNLTNQHTIEFRIFKATTNLERVLANVEFCDAMVNFTWPSHTGLKENTLKDFLSFMVKNRKRYPNLFGLLISKKYFKKPTVRKDGKPVAKKAKQTVIAA